MEIIKTIVIKLSKDELKKIIKEHVKSEGFTIDEKNISFELTSVWRGYGQDEHKETEFAGCSIICNK